MSDDTLTMLTVNKLIPGGRGLAAALLRRAAGVELEWDLRQRSRFDAVDERGRRLAVFLPRGSVVRGGDVLVAEDGTLLRVVAAPQPVLVVRQRAGRETPIDLLRAAYHLGNRHVAVELQPDHLKLEPDHVLAAMLKRMHLTVDEDRLPFEPDGGAYAAHGDAAAHTHGHGAAHGHAHDHEHEHGHDHDHDHGHAPGHAHDHGHATDQAHDHAHTGKAAPAPHVHGPGCGHDHEH